MVSGPQKIPAGNRTSRTVDGVGEAYTGSTESAYLLDTVTSSGGNQSFGYDDAGNLTSITRDGSTQTLDYNASGQVTSVDGTAYVYDGNGQRIGEQGTSGTTNYAIAPSAQGLGVDIGLRYLSVNGSGQLNHGWVYAGENAIARYDASGNLSYYLEDGIDSVIGLTDENGTRTQTYAYDAFGNVISQDNPEGDFGFHAAWHDVGTGLIDMRLRVYDPVTGRFTSVDPVNPIPEVYESFNPYTFGNQNPVVFSDPTGGFSLTEINVTQGVNQIVQRSQSIAINEVKDILRREIEGFVVNAIGNMLTKFVPGGIFDVLGDAGPREAGLVLEKDLKGLLCEHLSLPESLFLAPRVTTAGDPLTSGFNCHGSAGRKTPAAGRAYAIPDFIFSSEPPSGRIGDLGPVPDAYLVGDFKLTGNALRTSYFESPYKQRNQWDAITNYAKRHQYAPVALWITFFAPNTSTVEALKKEAISKEGIIAFVVSFLSTKK